MITRLVLHPEIKTIMKLYIDHGIVDEYVRIMDKELLLIAISSKSKSNPGLWMNKSVPSMKIIGVDDL